MYNSLNNKKIGCVIAYKRNHTNYGTALVGYSLLTVLQELGCQVEVINYIKKFTLRQKIVWVINALRCGMGHQIYKRYKNRRDINNNQGYRENIKVRECAVESFKEKRLLPLFKKYEGYAALCEGAKQYAAVIVGSDQVWLPQGLPTKFFNLRFVPDNVKKISYASSFGVSSIPKFQHKATGDYLNRFYKISVRELSGKKIVEDLSNQTAQVVADPTLLLDRKQWEKETEESKVQVNEPYIFCYFLGSNPVARKAASDLKEKTGYKIVALRHMDEYVKEDETFGDESPYNIDPIDFLKLIRDAQYVCTDSFHCTAFSVQFQRRFMTFYRFSETNRTGRNSRIDSLLSTLGIGREHVYQGDISKIDNPIKWHDTEKRLETLRMQSIDFLKEALNDL